MKTLVLSIGNSSYYGGVFAGGKPLRLLRAARTSAEAARLAARKGKRPFFRGKFDRIAICSVIPTSTKPIASQLRSFFGIKPALLTSDAPHGLKIGYRRPRELGTDRIAAAIGARKRFRRRNVIIVDCGTATTFTVLDRSGKLLGGAILPGLSLWPAMLATRTAQLPQVALRRPRAAVGRSPEESIRSGIFHGHAGAIREVVRRLRDEAFGRASVVVIGTGGNAEEFSGEKLFDEIVPALVLEGLNEFARRCAAQRL